MPSLVSRSYALAESDGINASVYISDDKGTSWILGGDIPESAVLIVRADPNNGSFAVIGSIDGVYYTRDGGFTWTASVGTYTATASNIKDITFVSSDIIYAIGDNHIIKSINGGISFENWLATEDLYGPGAIGYSIHYINEYVGVTGIEDKVYITSDMGYSWTAGNGNVALNAGEPVYSVYINTDLLTINACNINRIYRSVDNGNTFGVTFTASAPFTNRQKLFRIDNSNFFMLSNNTGQVYLSVNGGATWTLQGNIIGSYGTPNINDLYFYDVNDGILTPDASDIQITTDGGLSFTPAIVSGSPAFISVSSAQYTCSTCPEGWTYEASKNQCYRNAPGPPLCPDGYSYDTGLYNGEGGCYRTDNCTKDIIFLVDNTSSNSSAEIASIKLLLTSITTQLAGSLLSGDTEISIITFNSTATNILSLTNNSANIFTAINSIGISLNPTSALIEGLCEADLEFTTNGRLNAEKIILVFTDGCPEIGSCLYNGSTYDSAFQGSIEATLAMAYAMKNNFITIMTIVISQNLLPGVSYCLGPENDPNNPLYQTFPSWPFPSQNYAGDYLYFYSTPQNASILAATLVSNICYDAFLANCPGSGQIEVYGEFPNLNAYCIYLEFMQPIPCCYLLEDCNGQLADIFTESDLSEYVGKVIKIQGYPNTCWSVTDLSALGQSCLGNDVLLVTVISSLESCLDCLPAYKLTNCQNCDVILYSTQNLSIYANTNQVVTLDEYPNTCWVVSRTNYSSNVPQIVTINNTFQSCIECLPNYYELINCNNDDISIVVNDPNFAQHVGKVVEIFGHSGLCWSVNEMSCDCINVIVRHPSSGDYTFTLNNSGTLNGKNVYYLSILGNDYGIGWNNELNRWELFDVITLETASYSTRQSDCPFDGAWVAGTLQVISIQPCIDDIYNVSIVKIYPNCPCCLTNNCI